MSGRTGGEVMVVFVVGGEWEVGGRARLAGRVETARGGSELKRCNSLCRASRTSLSRDNKV